MKYHLPIKQLLLLSILVVNLTKASIPNDGHIQDADFRIVDHQSIQFTNPHRPNAVIKFSLKDANITEVKHWGNATWTLNTLGNWQTAANVYAEFHHNGTTKYYFLWKHLKANLSNEPEICFDLTVSNAKW